MDKLSRCFSRGFEAFGEHLVPLSVGALIAIALGVASLGLLEAPLFAGLIGMALTALRGGSPQVGDLFRGLKRFGPSVATGLLSALFLGVGFAVCVLPGLLMLPLWMFALPLVVDQELGAWAAMETSREKVMQAYGSWWAVAFIVGLLGSAASQVVPLVGSALGLALQAAVFAAAYVEAFESNGVVESSPLVR